MKTYPLMKKWLVVATIFLFIELGFIPTIAQDVGKPPQPTSRGKWWYVGGSGPGNYTIIQDAIDNASDGDTVFVYSGTYVGYIVINKSITLIGEDKNTTAIFGFFAYTVSIVSDWVNMSGFTIQNGGSRGEGVRIDSSDNNFFNNIIDIPRDRFRISGDRNTICGNTIRNTYMYLSGDSNTISRNTITNNYYGIFLTNACDNIISNNSLFNSGLFIAEDPVWNNSVKNNTVNGKQLVYFDGESDLVIDIDAGQILLINCTNITVQNQHLFNTTAGIQLWKSNDCIISCNILTGNHYGISLYGVSNTIDDNIITDNYYGIHFSGDSNIISGNAISNNNDGIYFSYGDYNNILKNTITHNQKSILLGDGSDFNNISNNTITHNYGALTLSGFNNTFLFNAITHNIHDGLCLFNSNYNDIIDNTITHNNGTGILVVDSDYNYIFNNSIAYNNCTGINNVGDSNTFFGNTITHNNHTGVNLFGTSNTLSGNTIINHNDEGIWIYKSDSNTIIYNNISNNRNGILLSDSNRNNITRNSILKNVKGIIFVSSTNNSVIKNNFESNKRHALFENYTNKWDRNYWGRPRILPKLIFGVKIVQNKWPVPFFDIDWHPAQKPYDISRMR